MEEEKKKQAECTKRYDKSNHGKQQRIICVYKNESNNSNPKPTLKYYIANAVVKGWLNIEDDEPTIYWVKAESSLSAHLFDNKVHN